MNALIAFSILFLTQSLYADIDQNPYVFVSSVKMLEQLQSNSLKINLNSVERDFKDQIEISIDPRTKRVEVSTITGSITAKCHNAFQIRKQD